eukprot:scaffold310420_cov13-Tisochrysis_lutea.AAC.1
MSLGSHERQLGDPPHLLAVRPPPSSSTTCQSIPQSCTPNLSAPPAILGVLPLTSWLAALVAAGQSSAPPPAVRTDPPGR